MMRTPGLNVNGRRSAEKSVCKGVYVYRRSGSVDDKDEGEWNREWKWEWNRESACALQERASADAGYVA